LPPKDPGGQSATRQDPTGAEADGCSPRAHSGRGPGLPDPGEAIDVEHLDHEQEQTDLPAVGPPEALCQPTPWGRQREREQSGGPLERLRARRSRQGAV